MNNKLTLGTNILRVKIHIKSLNLISEKTQSCYMFQYFYKLFYKLSKQGCARTKTNMLCGTKIS